MDLTEIVGIFFVCVVLLVLAALITSRAAIDRLTAIGFLPRAFANLIPLMTIVARSVSVVLTLVGLILVGLNAGLLSREWLSRYGFSVLLVVLGIFCMGITFRPKK